jgi:hypothetical protein
MHTLEEFVEVGQNSSNLSYYKTSILEGADTGILFSMDNVVYDYLDEVKSLREPVLLTGDQFTAYKYDGVNLLSYDVYGNRELSFIILAINGIFDPKDFDMNPIYMIRKDYLMEILQAIYNAEKEYLDWNSEKVGVNR